MSKITLHKDFLKIEQIILECKFLGLGSPEIKHQLLTKLAFDVSRPMIDKHYNECMNGEVLSELIAKTRKNAILSVSNGSEEGTEGIAPSFDQESANKAMKHIEAHNTDHDWGEVFGENACADNLKEIYGNTIGLVKGNFLAHLEGKERLKPEYLKYLKEVKELIKGARGSF